MSLPHSIGKAAKTGLPENDSRAGERCGIGIHNASGKVR